mgnify:CR=1 FL=1
MKRSSLNRYLLLMGVAMLVLSGCSHRRRAGAIPPEKLEAVLYDYHLAQVMVNDLPSSERYKKDLYFDYIYDKHKVTKAEIDSSLVYYARYPKDLSDIYVRLSARIESDIQRIEEADIPVVTREAICSWRFRRLVVRCKSHSVDGITNQQSLLIHGAC